MKPRCAPTQARAKDTVEVILTAADRVFSRVGVRAATTRDIAAVAGVSIGTLYRYFPSKDALFVALIQERWRVETQAFGELISNLAGRSSLRQTIEEVVLWVLQAIERNLSRYQTTGDVEAGFVLMTGPEKIDQVAALIAQALEPFRERLWPTDLRLAAIVVVRAVLLLGRVARRDYRRAFESGALARKWRSSSFAISSSPERSSTGHRTPSFQPFGSTIWTLPLRCRRENVNDLRRDEY